MKIKLPRVLITTVPFGEKDRKPILLMENAGIEYLINPYNRKLTEDQLADIVTDFDEIIATTMTHSRWLQIKRDNACDDRPKREGWPHGPGG